MSFKETVFVKINDFLFEEGIVVGKIIFQGNVTYRVLINNEKIIDATDDQLLNRSDYIKYAEKIKNEKFNKN